MSQIGQPPLPRLPRREPDSHKGTFGRALILGGSRGMAGSVGMSGRAALRGGAGLVRLAVPSGCQTTVAGFDACLMTLGLPEDEDGRIASAAQPLIAGDLASVTAAACGPGLGRSRDLDGLVAWLYRELPAPLVLDADALNSLASQPQVAAAPGGERVLTPHPGEFARLAELPQPPTEAERVPLAEQLARRTGAIVVLKGHQTVITDGRQTCLNSTGNSGMATAGMGDVLTGLVTALLCQRLAPFDAARLGVHVHGLAGDLAADDIGPVGITAIDVIERLPQALATVIG